MEDEEEVLAQAPRHVDKHRPEGKLQVAVPHREHLRNQGGGQEVLKGKGQIKGVIEGCSSVVGLSTAWDVAGGINGNQSMINPWLSRDTPRESTPSS